MRQSINSDSENIICLSFSDVDGYIIQESGNKYLIFALTRESKKVLETYKKLWNEIENQIETINGGESIRYKKDFLRIIFDSNDNDLPIGKILSIPVLSIVVKYGFQN